MAAVPSSDLFRVLVVDDSRDYADSVCEFIAATTTWQADVAYGGRDAIASTQAQRPDVVLLDLEIPPLTGFDVAEALEQQYPDDLPWIIAISGNTSLFHAALKDRRFSRALLKPANLSSLIAWLDKLRRTGEARSGRTVET